MIDNEKKWLVIENEQDEKWEENVKKKTLDKYPYKSLETNYGKLKPFLIKYTKFLQIGYFLDDEHGMPSGIFEINGKPYRLPDFKPETTIDMSIFKPFWKKLTENFKLHNYTSIKISYYQNKPVWFEIKQYNPNDRRDEIRTGIIIPEYE